MDELMSQSKCEFAAMEAGKEFSSDCACRSSGIRQVECARGALRCRRQDDRFTDHGAKDCPIEFQMSSAPADIARTAPGSLSLEIFQWLQIGQSDRFGFFGERSRRKNTRACG